MAEVSVSGIFLGKEKEEKDFIFSKVISISENVTEVKVGDEVLFNRHLADEVEDCYLVQEQDILAVKE